jgi:hypothetical protein
LNFDPERTVYSVRRQEGHSGEAELSHSTSDVWSDIKHAVRMFANNPEFTFAALAALTVGIGVNAAIFTVVDTVLLKRLTYPDDRRVAAGELLQCRSGKTPLHSSHDAGLLQGVRRPLESRDEQLPQRAPG